MGKFISNSGYEPKYGKLLHTLKKRKAVYQFFQDAEEETFIYFVKKTKTGTEVLLSLKTYKHLSTSI